MGEVAGLEFGEPVSIELTSPPTSGSSRRNKSSVVTSPMAM